jgi:ABC-type antimicrobial peptide transport system permease subunit
MLLLNRRNTLVIFLGLGISLAIISEGLIFMYSFQYDAFIEFNKEIPTEQVSVGIEGVFIVGQEDTLFSQFNNITNRVIEDVGINQSLLRSDWFGNKGTMLYIASKDNPEEGQLIPESNMYSIPPDFFSGFEEILYNGTLPYKENEVLVVTSRNIVETSNLTTLGVFPVYVPVLSITEDIYIAVDTGIPDAGNYVNVTGIVLAEDFENYKGTLRDEFRGLDSYFTDSFLITRYTNIMSFSKSILYNYGFMSFNCRFSLDLTKIDAFNIEGEIKKLQHFGQELEREFRKEGFDSTVHLDLIDNLKEFREEFIIFQLFGLLFITPIIGMALSLTNYSSNLMKRRQKRQISSMLQRGSSRREVLTLLIFQVGEFTIMAMLICVLIGYPFASLMLKSTGFLNFSGTSIFPAINMVIFYVIIGATMIFSIIINARNVWEMANISTEEAYGTTKEKVPTWQKTYIDIMLIVIGIILWLIVRLQIKGTSAYSFAYGFGTTAPICLILGSILFITRLYPHFISILSKIGWNRAKLGILGLSAKRSIRRKSSVIRSLVLISITFTLIISSITTISSYQKYDEEQAYYKLGADILIRNVKVENDDVKNRVLALEGVESGTYLKYTSQLTTYGVVTYSYLVIGINADEFVNVAYIENSYLDTPNSKQEFFNHLKTNLSVAMQKDQMDIIGLEVNDDFELTIEKYITGAVNYTVNIASVYNYFPRYFVEYPDPDEPVYRFSVVGNYNLTETLSYSKFSVGGDMLVKVASGYSIAEVAGAIEEELDRTVDSVDSLMSAFEGSLRNTMLYGSLNTLFISSMIITIAAISLMIFIQSIENEMEVNILKTLGMSPRQLFSMFTIEALTLVIFGSVLGLCVGLFSARMFLEILTLENILPPERLVFPLGQIAIGFGILFITAISSAALTSWIIFRKDTIKGIKQI